MLQFIPVFEANTIAIRASGKLTHEDYQNFLPQLEMQLKDLEEPSLLVELDNFIGWELGAVLDDFKFGMKHFSNFDRIAMVGDKSWEHWMTLMANPFLVSSEVRYFNRENLQDAWNWLREKQNLEEAAEQLRAYKNIVVAVDFSLYSKYACKRAIELANYYQASLTLLNVPQAIVAYPPYGAMGMYATAPNNLEEQNQDFIEAAKTQMEEFVKDLDTDLALNTKVISGDISSTIVSFLGAQNTDLVVFGAKKKKGLNKILGSTPHYVQTHSNCEVLIVPVQESVF